MSQPRARPTMNGMSHHMIYPFRPRRYAAAPFASPANARRPANGQRTTSRRGTHMPPTTPRPVPPPPAPRRRPPPRASRAAPGSPPPSNPTAHARAAGCRRPAPARRATRGPRRAGAGRSAPWPPRPCRTGRRRNRRSPGVPAAPRRRIAAPRVRPRRSPRPSARGLGAEAAELRLGRVVVPGVPQGFPAAGGRELCGERGHRTGVSPCSNRAERAANTASSVSSCRESSSLPGEL
jgi:hypothetical protein